MLVFLKQNFRTFERIVNWGGFLRKKIGSLPCWWGKIAFVKNPPKSHKKLTKIKISYVNNPSMTLVNFCRFFLLFFTKTILPHQRWSDPNFIKESTSDVVFFFRSLFLTEGRIYSYWTRTVLFPLLALIPPTAVAMVTNSLEFLVGITGSYAGAGIQYVVPAALVYYARQVKNI